MIIRFRSGGVLKIPLGADTAYGLMLTTFPYFGFYPVRSVREAAQAQIPPAERPLFTVAVHRSAYSSGRWGTVLYRVPEELIPPIPLFFRQNVMNPDDCEIVDPQGGIRKAIIDECIGLERSSVWSAEHVEQRLTDHYAGRPNKHVESMVLKRRPPD
jgi:hypothetical protein